MRRPKFSPYKGKVRRGGTGGIYELNDHLFEGRYSPTNAQGKREVHTVYAHTREECEEKLAVMIEQVRGRSRKPRNRSDYYHRDCCAGSFQLRRLLRCACLCVIIKE